MTVYKISLIHFLHALALDLDEKVKSVKLEDNQIIIQLSNHNAEEVVPINKIIEESEVLDNCVCGAANRFSYWTDIKNIEEDRKLYGSHNS